MVVVHIQQAHKLKMRVQTTLPLWLAGTVAVGEAFVPPTITGMLGWKTVSRGADYSSIPLFAEEEAAASSGEEATVEEETTEEPAEETETEPEEDPEITSLKQEIANLESTLKAKQSTLNYAKDQAETYSKAGYARKVAEMENMRRLRSSANSSSRETAMASIVQSFLPVMDQLNYLRREYGEDDFGSKYNAFAGDMRGAMTQLGVSEFSVEPGEVVDARRMQVVEEEYSEEIPKGSVVRALFDGYELQGNVMRMVEVVASLGSQEEAAAAEAAAAEEASSGEEAEETPAPEEGAAE